MVQAPLITITQGKVKRTVLEQTELQFNALVKGYLDKGYKRLSDFGIEDVDAVDLNKIIPKEITDQSGLLKPMLAKSSEGISSKILDRDDI